MRLLNKSTVIGTTLVALAILNFSVLDQIGVGLVESVNDRFTELGAEWIALHSTRPDLDPAALVQELATVPGVQQAMTAWSTSQITFQGSQGPGGVEWMMPGPAYDLEAFPYLFVFREETETGARFYRDAIVWRAGAPPGPGQFAVGTLYAEEHGLQVGDTVQQTFAGLQRFGGAGVAVNLSLSGIYERGYSDADGAAPDIHVLGHDAELQTALRGGGAGGFARHITLVQAPLSSVLAVADGVVWKAEELGHTVSTQEFQTGGRTFGGRGGFGGGSWGGAGGTGQGSTEPPDLVLYANGDVLQSALDAAERSGFWFRTLTTGAVLMAVLGIAFVTAAMEKKVRRDVGIRQALGYPVRRIYLHWATVATAMGMTGAVVGVGAVYLASQLGIAQSLLGLDLAFRSSLGVLLAPVAAVLVYGLATLPTYARVLRSAPAENLKVLSE